MANSKPTYLGRVRMLVSMQRIRAIKVFAEKYHWNQRETETNARLLDMALDPSSTPEIEACDRIIENANPQEETEPEKFWNQPTSGDKVERLLTARKIFDARKKKKRGR